MHVHSSKDGNKLSPNTIKTPNNGNKDDQQWIEILWTEIIQKIRKYKEIDNVWITNINTGAGCWEHPKYKLWNILKKVNLI